MELLLGARDANDVAIVPDAFGDINVTVGKVFYLELGYLDLRSTVPPLRKGVAKYIADLNLSQDGVLIPVVTETQQLGFAGELLDEVGSGGIITFSVTGSTQTVDVLIDDFLSSRAALATETINALVQLGFSADEVAVDFLDLRDPFGPPGEINLFVRVRFVGASNYFVNQPLLQVNVSGTSQPIPTSVDEYNPLNGDGTINSDAVPFILDANSRSTGNKYFKDLATGEYSETAGFNNLGGTNFSGPPNEFPHSADLSQPFDAISIPVVVTRAVSDLVVSIIPANDELADVGVEGIILWRDNDPLPLDSILVDDDGVITVNATPGSANVVIDDGTDQRSVVRSLTVTLDGIVDTPASSFTLINTGTAASPSNTEVTSLIVDRQIVGGQTIATITFGSGPSVVDRLVGNSLANGNYELSFDGATIFGNQMADDFFRLFGDSNGDGFTDFIDFSEAFLPSFGVSPSSSGFAEFMDFDGGNDVDFDDFAGGFLPNFGTSR